MVYMDRGEVKVHKEGWVDGYFVYKTDIRERLEFLLGDTSKLLRF